MRLLALVVAVIVLAGCSSRVDGTARKAPRDADAATFFAGEVPVYGQTVSANDQTLLAYQRALRRLDVCGLLDRETFAEIGEIGPVGTLLYLNACDFDVKVNGESDVRYAFIEVKMQFSPDTPVAFEASGSPVYETFEDACEYVLPLDLSGLPGAQPLRGPTQPYLQVELLSDADCAFTRRLAEAVAAGVASRPLPVRDAVATYPHVLAERDPCEILAVLGDDVDDWRPDASEPYECDFDVRGPDSTDAVGVDLFLEPQFEDIVIDEYERRLVNDVELFVDPEDCKAVAFVGRPMQRKLLDGDFVDTDGDLVSRPTVTVYGGSYDDDDGAVCGSVFDVTARAAKLFGA